MTIKITSKQDGFWRCGVQHKAEPVFWPDDKFSAEELDRLIADTTLIVDIIYDPVPNPEPDGIPFATDEKGNGLTIEQMSAAQLRALAAYMGMEPFKNNASKAKMLEAIEAYAKANNLTANEKGELPLGEDKNGMPEGDSGQPTGEPEPPAADGAADPPEDAAAETATA